MGKKIIVDQADQDFQNFIVLPVAKLQKAPWNYKKDDEFKAGQLVNNIKKNGQMENIIVREIEKDVYEVVNGNHRLDAVITLGRKKIIAFNAGKISQGQAERLAIVTNETRFESDQVKLAQLITKMSQEFPLEDLAKELPWTEEQILNFTKLTEFNWEHPTVGGDSDPEIDTGVEGWTTVKLRLPDQIAEQLERQIERIKRLLHPGEEDITLISPVQAIEKMIQHVAQLPDSQIL